MKKADNFDPSKWLVENKITTQSNKLINEAFEDLIQQLSAMAEKGEIDNTQIKSIENTLMSARRQGQSAARKNSPDYAEKAAAAKEKASATRAANKAQSEKWKEDWAAMDKEKEQEKQDRRASGKLPLTIDTYMKGVEKTKQLLGDLAQYYREVTPMQGPGSSGAIDLKLKPAVVNQSFDNAQVAWNVYDRK
jgi:hypothetical protein